MHQLQLVRRRLVEHRDDQGVEKDALARARRAGDQQVRHLRQVGHADAPNQIFSQRQGQLRRGIHVFRRFDDLAQLNRLPVLIRHFDADRGFARYALDQNGLGAQSQAEIVRQSRDAAIFDARLGLELVGGDHRSGIDLRHVPADVELPALLLDGVRALLQFVFLYLFAALGHAQKPRRRQPEAGLAARDLGFAAALLGCRFRLARGFRENQQRCGAALSLLFRFFRRADSSPSLPGGSLPAICAANACVGTGWRPAVLLISTRSRSLACSRASRQAAQRALSLPIGSSFLPGPAQQRVRAGERERSRQE